MLDKKVISSPVIQAAITGGEGQISGNFTQASANAFAVQLRYGSLPVPVQVAESRTVGATLGAESVQKSVLAGINQKFKDPKAARTPADPFNTL